MKPSITRRFRRQRTLQRESGVYKKGNHEQQFFGDSAKDTFFQPTVIAQTQSVQRKCEKCEEEDKKVHKKDAANVSTAMSTNAASGYINSLQGKGATLPKQSQQFFSSKMGYDFSNVKIHTGTEAEQSAKSLQARAYNYGNNIVFNEGQYNPDSYEGKKLLAHELTHYVQQNSGVQRTIFRAPDTKTDLQTTYNITIEKGDKDWSEAEIGIIKSALSRLVGEEKKVVRNYKFIRWSTQLKRSMSDPDYKNPGVSECGLHEADFLKGNYKISMYDECFADPEAVAGSDVRYGIDTGEFNLLHEIGHAMEVAEYRTAYEKYIAANKAYNDAIEKYTTADEQAKHKSEISKLDAAEKDADAKMKTALDRGITEFGELIAGKDSMTEYAKTSTVEAFGEAFATFKADPEFVKTDYKDLFAWMSKQGYLAKIKAKAKPKARAK